MPTERQPRHYHVALHGNDTAEGAETTPLRTIATASKLAQAGDTICVHAGIYREAIDPPRGGTSNTNRITYEAASGEAVEIRGSEVITDWTQLDDSTWTTAVPNALFGEFNPYTDLIRGDWFRDEGRPHHTGCVYINDEWLIESATREALKPQQWFAEVDDTHTTFYVNFGCIDPNTATTEMNVRPSVFYPSKTGINYITVRGFKLRHAATNWAPPTAEQVGLIGTNWSKGWIIEHNTITHSRCTGITLGKYGDTLDNTSHDKAEGYVATVRRALENGWNRDTVGSHIVRHNEIAYCEQAGIVGSLGAIFSQITNNVIHDIYQQQLFTGEEQAAIKFHAPIDTLIERNHIYRTVRAIWLDWMTQGTRVSRNVCHDNEDQDLFLEVNHGPLVVDHNLFLSQVSLKNWSQGGAFIHNLFGGKIISQAEPHRDTPYHHAHSTEIQGLSAIPGGDERFYNNQIVDAEGLEQTCAPWRDSLIWKKDPITNIAPMIDPQTSQTHPTTASGNIILAEAPTLHLDQNSVHLSYSSLPALDEPSCNPVNSDTLGISITTSLPYRNHDGTDLQFESDYFGHSRSDCQTIAGPFAEMQSKQRDIFKQSKVKTAPAPLRT